MKLKENKILFIILLIAFFLRLGGIFHGYPLMVFSDEGATLLASLKMIGTFSLRAGNALGYYYPALLSYVFLPFLSFFIGICRWLGVFTDIQQIKETVLLNIGFFAPLIRLVSVLFGTATVYLVYRITKALFNKSIVSLLAAWFLAVSFYHSGVSHYGNTWTIQTFFYLLVLLWAINFLKKSTISFRDYIYGALLVGLSFGINFVGIITYTWFLIVHFLKNRNKNLINTFLINKNFWLANFILLAFIAIIYWLNPAGLNNYFNRITVSVPRDDYASYQLFHDSTLSGLFFYLKNVFFVEPFLCVFFLVGSWMLWKKEKTAFLLVSVGALLYLALLSPQTGLLIRYALPLDPLLAIVSAYFLYELFSVYSKKLGIILLVVASLYVLMFGVLFNLRLMKIDTRVLARNWILSDLPSGSSIKNYDLADEINLIEDKASINLIQNYLPGLLSTRRKYLFALEEYQYPKPNFFVLNYELPAGILPKTDYIILSDIEKKDLDSKAGTILDEYSLIKRFYPVETPINGVWPGYYELGAPFNHSMFKPLMLFRLYGMGPYVEIYKIKSSE
ncbi:MAG: glycosyltransferase family 39 protein [Patescibacteria group bacterium]